MKIERKECLGDSNDKEGQAKRDFEIGAVWDNSRVIK
jgi:hypothetical protein